MLFEVLDPGRFLAVSRLDVEAFRTQPRRLSPCAAREVVVQPAVVFDHAPVRRDTFLPGSTILFSRFGHDADGYAGAERAGVISPSIGGEPAADSL
jgi:hypothetical protein